MFLYADSDGFKLDANHNEPIEDDDIPDLIKAFQNRTDCERLWEGRDSNADWMERWWFVDIDAIRAADFNLSPTLHRPQNRPKVDCRDPLEILSELKAAEAKLSAEIDELTGAVHNTVVK